MIGRIPDDNPYRKHAVRGSRQDFYGVNEGFGSGKAQVNHPVGSGRDVRENLCGGNIITSGVVDYVESEGWSTINRELLGAGVLLKTRRFREQEMNFVNARWHRIIALKNSAPARDEEFRVFGAPDHVTGSCEFVSPRAELVSSPSGSSAINVWTGIIPHHGAQGVSGETRGNDGGLSGARTSIPQGSRPPIPGQYQKYRDRQNRCHA